jgi:hypothetical protein
VQEKPSLETGGRRLVFGQLLRVLVCSGTGPESSTGSPDLLGQAALAARATTLCLHPDIAVRQRMIIVLDTLLSPKVIDYPTDSQETEHNRH